MSEHTPGPWKASDEPGAYDVCVVEHENWRKNWYVATDGPKRAEPEPDACLIAAAPDLLAACELSLEWLDSVCDENFSLGAEPEGIEAKRQIVAAIAKAKGESDE